MGVCYYLNHAELEETFELNIFGAHFRERYGGTPW